MEFHKAFIWRISRNKTQSMMYSGPASEQIFHQKNLACPANIMAKRSLAFAATCQ